MKKGICFGSLPGKLSPKEKFQLAKDAGFDGVEIGTIENKDEGRAVVEAAKSVGIRIPSIMGGLHWQCPLSSPDAETRAKCVANVERSLELAAEAGADTVLLVPGVVTDQVTYEEAMKRSKAEIKKLAASAKKRKIYIGIENVWNKFLLSPIEFAKYVDGFKCDYIQAYFDVGNILLYGYPQHWIRTLGKRIKKVHVKDFNVGAKTWEWLLEGNVPWVEVTKALKEIGYNDFLTAELPPYPVFPEQMVYDTGKHLDKIIAGA
jgi:hexulose-6-phosphate isomerase